MLVCQWISQVPPRCLQNHLAWVLASLERIGYGNRHGFLPYQILPSKLRNGTLVRFTTPLEGSEIEAEAELCANRVEDAYTFRYDFLSDSISWYDSNVVAFHWSTRAKHTSGMLESTLNDLTRSINDKMLSKGFQIARNRTNQ